MSACPFHDGVDEALELLAPDGPVQARARTLGVVAGDRRASGRARLSPRRGRAHPRAALPPAPAGRPRPRARRGGGAASACRRGDRFPAPFPSRRSRRCSRARRRRSGTRSRAIGRRSRLPPPRTQAAANSEPVFNAHRSRYASTVVVGSFRWRRCRASPRASASDASARTTTCSREPVRARRANAAANRWSPAAFAASAPCAVQAAARPRRRCAPSTMSSWISEAMCTSSTEAPSATGSDASGRERGT